MSPSPRAHASKVAQYSPNQLSKTSESTGMTLSCRYLDCARWIIAHCSEEAEVRFHADGLQTRVCTGRPSVRQLGWRPTGCSFGGVECERSPAGRPQAGG